MHIYPGKKIMHGDGYTPPPNDLTEGKEIYEASYQPTLATHWYRRLI
jgi:hypothetical protein